MNRQNTVK